ncbi:MAG: hypothetical protein AAFR75_08110, partial [Pseudomonadota bacterium]
PKTAALNEPITQPVTTKNCSAAPAAVTTKPLPAGRMEIDISAPCHPEAIVKVGYSEFTFLNQLDTAGHGRILLDAFLPNIRTAVVSLPGNDTRQVPIVTRDQDRITKTAVIWNAPVNLDIHALEYAALRGQAGHVWAKSASTAEAALRKTDRTDKGRGFLTILDGATDAASTRAEVYTFVHTPNRQSGTISLALDFETRATDPSPDFCSDGDYASIRFEVFISRPDGSSSRERGLIPPHKCGDVITEGRRYLTYAIPDIRLRR